MILMNTNAQVSIRFYSFSFKSTVPSRVTVLCIKTNKLICLFPEIIQLFSLFMQPRVNDSSFTICELNGVDVSC